MIDTNNTDNTTDAAEVPIFVTMTDMLRFKAVTEDTSFPVTEMFFDQEKGLLKYVALDVGGWFDRREVIVSPKLMGEPNVSSREWPIEITQDAIKQAPEWSDPNAMVVVPIGMMPPIMMGPYGGHFAGQTRSGLDQQTTDETQPGNLKVEGFARLNEWVGLPVHGTDGEVGTLVDLVFDPDSQTLSHVVIDTGRFLAARQMVVPYDLLVRLSPDGSYVEMNVTAELLRESPPLEQFTQINRSWRDTLRAYYQLAPRI